MHLTNDDLVCRTFFNMLTSQADWQWRVLERQCGKVLGKERNSNDERKHHRMTLNVVMYHHVVPPTRS